MSTTRNCKTGSGPLILRSEVNLTPFPLLTSPSDPVAPFIDRKGYLDYIDRAEATLAKQRGGKGAASPRR